MFQELNACPTATWCERRRGDRGDFHGHLQIHTRVTASARDEVQKIECDLQVSRECIEHTHFVTEEEIATNKVFRREIEIGEGMIAFLNDFIQDATVLTVIQGR